MKHILLPTDFSENSLNAIDYALALFRNWECKFHILNVQKLSEYITDDLMASSPTESIYDRITMDNKIAIHKLVKRLSKDYKSQPFTFNGLFDYDHFVSAVNQAVKFHSIDLIVMGTNGATGASEVVFGSNTLKVLRNADCPIMAVPEGFKFKSLKKALFTMNTNERNCLSHIAKNLLIEILKMHQSTFELLAINELKEIHPRNKIDQTEEMIIDYPFHCYSIRGNFDWYTLQIATQLLKTDMKVVKLERESLVKRLIFGSNHSELISNSMVPILFLK